MTATERVPQMLPVVVRVGLGVLWIVSGPTSSWLVHAAADGGLSSHPGLLRLADPGCVLWLRAAEAALGVSLIAGFWLRGLAGLQVALLSVLAAAALATGSGASRDPAFVVSAGAAMAGALGLAWAGGGAHTLDGWLGRNRTVRRYRLRCALERHRLLLAGVEEMCGIQVQAVADSRVLSVLDTLRLDAGETREDVASVVQRLGGGSLPLLGPVRGLSWAVGCLTVLGGMRVALRVHQWLVGRALTRYSRMEGLAAPEDGITVRALAAMREREARHAALLRSALEKPRRTGGRQR